MTEEKKVNSNRINFKHDVPDLLFRQAGGKCSVPRCEKPTMGPSTEGPINMGVACHIYSAAENGPRGRGRMSDEFISSEKNGIWCCAYHASLIDKKNGVDFPASNLFTWKKLAEARTRKLMDGVLSPLGWVDSIEITELANVQKPKISLSKNTIIWGMNGTGKTSLLHMAAAISHSNYAEGFNDYRKTHSGQKNFANYQAELEYTTVDDYSKKLKIQISNGILTRFENNNPCLLPPGDIEIIFCSENELRRETYEDDVDYFTRVLKIDKSALYALASIGTKVIFPGRIQFKHAEEELEDEDSRVVTKGKKFKTDGKPYIELMFNKLGSSEYTSFEWLSGSKQSNLILDLLISKAREIAKQRLTLLLFEGLLLSLDEHNFNVFMEFVEKESFQTVVSLPQYRKKNFIDDSQDPISLKNLEKLAQWRLVTLNREP